MSSFEASSHACELEVVKYVREQLMESLMEIHTERSRTERFLALSGSDHISMVLITANASLFSRECYSQEDITEAEQETQSELPG